MMAEKEPTFGELLIQSARESVAIKRGEMKAPREAAYRITARSAAVKPPPRYDAEGVKEIRGRLELSQQLFAEALNVSRETVRAWEQGKRRPEGSSLRLLELAARSPAMFLGDVQPRRAERAPGGVVRTKHGAFERLRGAAGPKGGAGRTAARKTGGSRKS